MLFWPIINTLLISMLPIVELRGAIPVGVAAGLSVPLAFAIAFVGNLLPLPFIILFIKKIFIWIKKKYPRFEEKLEKLENKTRLKAEKAKKYKFFGLLIFVAIPLPGTGGWTGAFIAALLDMRVKDAMPAIALGVLIAGIIISTLTYGVSVLVSGATPEPTAIINAFSMMLSV